MLAVIEDTGIALFNLVLDGVGRIYWHRTLDRRLPVSGQVGNEGTRGDSEREGLPVPQENPDPKIVVQNAKEVAVI